MSDDRRGRVYKTLSITQSQREGYYSLLLSLGWSEHAPFVPNTKTDQGVRQATTVDGVLYV